MGQDLAVDTAPIGSAAAGPHAERLSNLVTAQRATVDRETGLELFRDMTLGRRFEDKCAEMYYRGKMFGFVHLYNGQEAVSTGVIGAMKRQHDWFCSTYRDHVHALSAGVPAREVMSELFGKGNRLQQGAGWFHAPLLQGAPPAGGLRLHRRGHPRRPGVSLHQPLQA
jgi:pyruvate dehydrogenase E1 component alpha subunit